MSRIHFLKQFAVEDRHYNTKKVLDDMIEGEYNDRFVAANHPDLSHDQMGKLSKDPEYVVRISIARRPDIPVKHLYRLHHDEYGSVRFYAEQNPVSKTAEFQKYHPGAT